MKRMICASAVAVASGFLLFPAIFGGTAGLFFSVVAIPITAARYGSDRVHDFTPQIVFAGTCCAAPIAGFLVGMLVGWIARGGGWKLSLLAFLPMLPWHGLPLNDPRRIEPLTTLCFWFLSIGFLSLGGRVGERLTRKDKQ